jgi:TonB family protein
MRTLSRTSAVTLAAQRELQTALLSRANDALRDGQLDNAQRLLSAITDLGPFAGTSELRRQLQSAQTAAAHPRPAPPRADVQPTPAPAPPVAVATAPAQPSFIAAHPTRELLLSYPPNQTAQGTVVVEFTLERNGKAHNVRIVQSTLPDAFSELAIEAVGRGRFDTHELIDGQPAQARLRLRFQPATN